MIVITFYFYRVFLNIVPKINFFNLKLAYKRIGKTNEIRLQTGEIIKNNNGIIHRVSDFNKKYDLMITRINSVKQQLSTVLTFLNEKSAQINLKKEM